MGSVPPGHVSIRSRPCVRWPDPAAAILGVLAAASFVTLRGTAWQGACGRGWASPLPLESSGCWSCGTVRQRGGKAPKVQGTARGLLIPETQGVPAAGTLRASPPEPAPLHQAVRAFPTHHVRARQPRLTAPRGPPRAAARRTNLAPPLPPPEELLPPRRSRAPPPPGARPRSASPRGARRPGWAIRGRAREAPDPPPSRRAALGGFPESGHDPRCRRSCFWLLAPLPVCIVISQVHPRGVRLCSGQRCGFYSGFPEGLPLTYISLFLGSCIFSIHSLIYSFKPVFLKCGFSTTGATGQF